MNDTRQNSNAVYRWVVAHDDSWVFVALYIGLAVVLSAFISLFWLMVVVGVHFVFELIRQRHVLPDGGPALAEALWELRLDVALIVFAMAVALYMDFVLGVAGLRLAPRLGRAVSMGARGGARFAAWSRILRGVILSVDDAAQFVRALVFGRKRAAEAAAARAEKKNAARAGSTTATESACPKPPFGSWAQPWQVGDYLVAGFFVVSVLLAALAPLLTEHTVEQATALLLSELHPLGGR